MNCLVFTSGVPRHYSNPELSQGVEDRAAPPSHPKERLNSELFRWIQFRLHWGPSSTEGCRVPVPVPVGSPDVWRQAVQSTEDQ